MNKFELLSEIALSLMNSNDFHSELNYIFNLLGESFNISRVYLLINNHISEWCNKGINSNLHNLKKISFFNCTLKEELNSNKIIIYNRNNSDFNTEPLSLLVSDNTNSIVLSAIYTNKLIKGFIGFESYDNNDWSKSDIDIINTVSEIISNEFNKFNILKSLKEDKENFENYINSTEDLIIISNINCDILFKNRVAKEKLNNYPNLINLFSKKICNDIKNILSKKENQKKRIYNINILDNENCSFPAEVKFWLGKWNNQLCIFALIKDLSTKHEALIKFEKLFENNPALMAVCSLPDLKFIDVNNSFKKKLRYLKKEVIGKSFQEINLFIDIEKQKQISTLIKKYKQINDIELSIKSKNNKIIRGLFSGTIIRTKEKEYLLAVFVDITKQIELQENIDFEKSRLKSIINGTRLGTWEWNIQTGETIFNRRWAEIIGYTLEEISPTDINTWTKFAHPEDLKKSSKLLEEHFSGKKEYYDLECRMKHKQGHWIWVHDRGKVIKWDNQGKPLMMYGTHFDITIRKEMEEKIKDLSIRDPLTNIYNRRYLLDSLNKDISKFKRDNLTFSLSIIDIDYFKSLNDSYGHLAGDFILKKFTNFISEHIRIYDLLGRYGGEEFLIIMYNTNKSEAHNKIEAILEKFQNKTFQYKNQKISFTFSCGVCDSSEIQNKKLTIETIISLSDKRLYIAKNRGRNQVISNDEDNVSS